MAIAQHDVDKHFPSEWLKKDFVQFCLYDQELVKKACQNIYDRKVKFTLDSFFDAVDINKNSCFGKTVKRGNLNNRELLESNLDKDLGAFTSLPAFSHNTLPLNGGARPKQRNTLVSISEKDNIDNKRHIHNSGAASDSSTDSGYTDSNESGVLSLPEHFSVLEPELSLKTSSNLGGTQKDYFSKGTNKDTTGKDEGFVDIVCDSEINDDFVTDGVNREIYSYKGDKNQMVESGIDSDSQHKTKAADSQHVLKSAQQTELPTGLPNKSREPITKALNSQAITNTRLHVLANKQEKPHSQQEPITRSKHRSVITKGIQFVEGEVIDLSEKKKENKVSKKLHTDDPHWPEYQRLFIQQRCNTCWAKHADTLNLPCRHLNSCQKCSEKQESCSKCGEEIIGTVKIFFS